MFELEAFIEDCLRLSREPHAPRRVLERMREAMADTASVAKGVTPLDAKVGVLDAPLYRSPELTVLNVTLRPGILSIAHDHRMWAVIGIYAGEEINTFYRRQDDGSLEEANHRTIHAGESMLLGEDVIHAIENPLPTPTLGLHVYGGDLLGGAGRRMWDPQGKAEHAYETQQFYRWSREKAEARKAAAAG
ncbi:MAG TPA: hypothetical protein VG939_04180 [Caulobacteraceae bacterium]|nr:hypothetical protein [Caulobacteraceae bacterium]